MSFAQDGKAAWYDYLGIASTDADEDVTVEKASRIDTYFSCLNALAQDGSRLPFSVKQKTDKGRIEVNNNIHKLIHDRPNSYTNAANFWYNIIFNMLSWGNAYALINRNTNYQPRELLILHPKDVECVLYEGEIFYQLFGSQELIAQSELLHFKMYTFDGAKGISPAIQTANTFGYRIKQNKYRARVIGRTPIGFLSFQENLSPEQHKQAMKMANRMTEGENMGKIGAFSGGAKFNHMGLDPDAVQMIESLNLSDEQIMGILRVPPTIIQKYKDSAFKGPEQQDLVYLKYALSPILKVIEQECNYKLFPEANKKAANPLYTKFNVKEMLRGSLKEQGEWYKLLMTLGLATIDEIRELEDLTPFNKEWSKMPVIQGAYIPLDQLKGFYQGKDNSGGDEDERQLGFMLKDALDRIELMNNHE